MKNLLFIEKGFSVYTGSLWTWTRSQVARMMLASFSLDISRSMAFEPAGKFYPKMTKLYQRASDLTF
jgi:hypothetical protein